MLINNNEAKTTYSRLLFLKLANTYNHQFIKLNDEYELKKSEVDRKAEIKKSLETEVSH